MALTGMAAALLVTTSSAQAPPRGDFEEFRQRRMESYRERLEVTADAEWKLIEERINKISEARREAGVGAFGGGRGFFGRPQRDGNDGPGAGRGNGDRGGRRFGGAAMPEFEELQKAIEAKSSPEEIKAKLAKLRDARKAKQANVVKAQDDLRKVLTVRQEAVAVMMGLLD